MKPHGNRFRGKTPRTGSFVQPPAVQVEEISASPSATETSSDSDAEAVATLRQLEKVVSEFMVKYPSHSQRIPAVRSGENPLIAFVRAIVGSMAAKQEELERLNEEVLEAAREKERFLANMSHEVRTPMNGIFGMVNLLLEKDLDEESREYLETIHASSESLLNILDDILDYAKLNSKNMQLRPRDFELSKLIRDALWTYKPNADKKGVFLSATIDDTLPDHFVADDLRLKQVLSNLVSNGIKFTDEGEVSVTVQGIEKSGRKLLLFQVEDTGIGIRPEAGKTLFSPFRQVDENDERRFEGTGLGLAICKNLVELMGGRVWFESESGKGTRFFFTIEYADSENGADEEAGLVNRRKLNGGRSTEDREDGKLRVLLVEDNKVNQKVASLTLQQLGCEVSIAENGQEAVDIADGPISFDLVCMDVNMPVMNGIDAASAIRNLDHENAQTTIFAMTGMAFDEDRDKCLAAGMDDVITKPFDLQDLRERIENVREKLDDPVGLPS